MDPALLLPSLYEMLLFLFLHWRPTIRYVERLRAYAGRLHRRSVICSLRSPDQGQLPVVGGVYVPGLE